MISVLAPLVRGLCINIAKAPRIVLAGTSPAQLDGTASKNALIIDMESAFDQEQSNGGTFNEQAAAKALSEAYAAWEFEISPSGTERNETVKRQPA